MLYYAKILRLSFWIILLLSKPVLGTTSSFMVHINSLTDPQVQDLFIQASKKHLYLFDVDSTLLTPSNPLLQPKAGRRHASYLYELKQKMSDFEWEIFNHIWVMESTLLLTESQWPTFIKQAQDQGAVTLGFTAAKTGSVGSSVRCFPEKRYESLSKQGIDFHSYHPELYIFDDLDDFGPDKPGISQGIVYAGHKCKKEKEIIGKLLKILLANDNNRFETIIAFDDRLEIVENLYKFMQENYPHIRFIGVHYRYINNLVDNDTSLEEFKEIMEDMYLRAIHIAQMKN